MQDPWRNDFYLDKPRSQRPPKFFISYNIDKYLEAATVPFADGIISVSEGYKNDFLQRYPSLTPEKFAIIPFGASYRDFDIMKDNRQRFDHLTLHAGNLNIVYVGRGGHDLRFALEIIFSAFRKGLSEFPDQFKKARFTFIGTSYAPEGKGAYTIKPVAEKFGVEDYVTEMPGRISYFETLNLLQKADVLLVPGSVDTSYTASKIYPYILARKPLLAVFYYKSSVVNVLEQLQFGKLVKFDPTRSSGDYAEECLRCFNELFAMKEKEVDLNKDLFLRYTDQYKTEEQVNFFAQVLKQAGKV